MLSFAPQSRGKSHLRSIKEAAPVDFNDARRGRDVMRGILQRAEDEFDLDLMLNECKDWPQVKGLVTELKEKLEKDGSLAVGALLKVSEVSGPLPKIKVATQRKEIKRTVDELAELILPNMGRMKGKEICSIVLALGKANYVQPKLIKAVLSFLSLKEDLTVKEPRERPGSESEGAVSRPFKPKAIFSAGQRVAILSVLAQLGVRPPPPAMVRILQVDIRHVPLLSD